MDREIQLTFPGLEHEAIPLLSKTRFMGGLQCLKRLYLESYHRELVPAVGPAQQALFDSGNAVGELARGLFPGGRLIKEDQFAHARAVERTHELIADQDVPAIFEAGFTFDGIRTRLDILKRVNGDQFVLGEVKSSTRVKSEYIPDAAIQVYVAEGSGTTIRNVYLVHIDRTYVYPGGPYNLEQLFKIEDITAEVRSYMADSLPADLGRMKEMLARRVEPLIDIGGHCSQPYVCPFYDHCREGIPEHHIEQLPGARARLLDTLLAAGVDDIRNIPEGFLGLTALQWRMQESVLKTEPYIGPELKKNLEGVEYPQAFLDFETFNPALPLYAGTRPYQVIPFQWSIHIQDEEGNLEHKSFLHEGADDPRPAFIQSLLAVAGTTGSIVIYSSFEETRLRQLAVELPEYGASLLQLCERMFDLHRLVRENYYHPELHGSFSLKSVLPVLVPDLGYDDLEIAEGSVASVAYSRMIYRDTSNPERERLRDALLAYCERDTEAMVRIHYALMGSSLGGVP